MLRLRKICVVNDQMTKQQMRARPPPPALRSLRVGQTQPGVSLLFTCLSAVTGIATMFTMLYIARMDAFAEVDRVERLKEVILKV